MDYKEFLKTKAIVATPTGFDIDKSELNDNMFEFQKDLCKWALKKGKSAILIGCGCGSASSTRSYREIGVDTRSAFRSKPNGKRS